MNIETNDIITSTTKDGIAIGKIDIIKDVSTIAADQCVGTAATSDIVVAIATGNSVVSMLTIERIVQVTADQSVITITCVNSHSIGLRRCVKIVVTWCPVNVVAVGVNVFDTGSPQIEVHTS